METPICRGVKWEAVRFLPCWPNAALLTPRVSRLNSVALLSRASEGVRRAALGEAGGSRSEVFSNPQGGRGAVRRHLPSAFEKDPETPSWLGVAGALREPNSLKAVISVSSESCTFSVVLCSSSSAPRKCRSDFLVLP